MNTGNRATGQFDKVGAIEVERVEDVEARWAELRWLLIAFESYHQSFQPRRLLPDWEERLKQRLKPHDDRLILIAWTDAEPVGCLVVVVRRSDGLAFDTYGYLTYAFVREDVRSRGIGRQLLAYAEDWCRERGAERVELDVFGQNELGYHFWNGAGYGPLSLTLAKSLEPAT
jgi:GNAT superfamily N-acetyltransferase